MRLQFTLTSAEGKRFIAKGIASLDLIKNALKKGKLILKGGTTVSAISEELVEYPLRISGRITSSGTKTAKYESKQNGPHSILVDRGKIKAIDNNWQEEMSRLTRNDILITGANIIDVYGNAAMMAGSQFGEKPGLFIQGAWTEGINVIIAAGLEKMISGKVSDVIKTAGRKRVDKSYGMAVGLIPIFGKLFTEIEAIKAIGEVDCHVIGKGGINGAEGSTTFIADGSAEEIKKVEDTYHRVMGKPVSGIIDSLEECIAGSPGCKNHLGCIYKLGKFEDGTK